MSKEDFKPTNRFSDRVENYVKYRPGYPLELFNFLKLNLNMKTSCAIVEVGSGTGIFAENFLREGFNITCVEPNKEMRKAAEKLLRSYSGFKSIDGQSEATTLPDHSFDFIFAVQAFHWFDAEKTKTEFKRILKSNGMVVLIWNERRIQGSPFLSGYEELVNEYGIDYQKVNHKNIDSKLIKNFLGDNGYGEISFFNYQDLDFTALIGRLASSSYMPNNGHPKYSVMVAAFKKLFDDCQMDGRVKIEYDAKVFYSQMS